MAGCAGEGCETTARTTATGPGQTRTIEVRCGNDLLGAVQLSDEREVLGAAGERPAGTTTGGRRVRRRAAWPAASADPAAAARWGHRHRTVLTATHLDAAATEDDTAVLDAAARHLRDTEVRRIDVRLDERDPRAEHLDGPLWVSGRVDGTIVASRVTDYPWTRPQPDPDWVDRARLPSSIRRALRRGRSAWATPPTEMAATAAREISGAIRLRQLPRRNQHVPTSGAPDGAHPFAASRRRTVDHAMALVPPQLRRTRLVDIGAGDGRVLLQALDLGFDSVLGRELDPELGRRARRAVGDAGSIEVGDALADPLPDDTGVVFLNNPFDHRGVADLATLIDRSLQRRARPMLVVFLNPASVTPLLSAGLELVEANPSFSILAGGPEQ